MKYIVLLVLFISCGNKTTASNEEGVTTTTQAFELEDPFDPATHAQIKKKPISDLPSGSIDFGVSCDRANGVKEFYFYEDKIFDLGGFATSPYSSNYPETLEGFDRYLKDSGVVNFSAREVSRSNHPEILKTCGLKNLLPPRPCWIRSVVLLLMAEKIRKNLGHPISVESHYRSSCYNKELYKSFKQKERNSDHLLARALDLSYKGAVFSKTDVRKKVQQYICENYWFKGRYNSDVNFLSYTSNLSAGFGNTRIHFGIDSPKGRRSWSYNGDGILKEPHSRECFWDDTH